MLSKEWGGAQVAMRPSGSPESLERRRLRAISLYQEGLQPVEIARRVRVSL
jgi:transposase